MGIITRKYKTSGTTQHNRTQGNETTSKGGDQAATNNPRIRRGGGDHVNPAYSFHWTNVVITHIGHQDFTAKGLSHIITHCFENAHPQRVALLCVHT